MSPTPHSSIGPRSQGGEPAHLSAAEREALADFLAANPNPGISKRPWFEEAYYPVARIDNPLRVGEEAIVYRKRPGAELPPPRPPWVPRHRRSSPRRQ